VRGGKLRAFGVTSVRRQSSFPDVPAIGEFVPGFESEAWFGLFGPAKMPVDVTKKLNDALVAAVNEPMMRAHLSREGATPSSMSSAEFADFVLSDIRKWAPIVRRSGARPD
jgi:tripartite-type tricarboxylate transporter receptor subunit TctC